MKKRLLLLALISSFVLAGCDFYLPDFLNLKGNDTKNIYQLKAAAG